MGFLDKQSRVIDFVLTERGRRLYATGELDFSYFSLFDDGVDYDPYATGSLTHDERELQIEHTLMLEAPFIREVRGANAPLEPMSHIFTAAAEYSTIPHMSSPATGSQIDLNCNQSQEAGLYTRRATNIAQIKMVIDGGTEPTNPGYIVRVFTSGSNGITEIDPRNDLAGRRSYDPFIALAIDEQPVTQTRMAAAIRKVVIKP